MSDLDFDELDKAINELYESLDDEPIDASPIKETLGPAAKPEAKPVIKPVAKPAANRPAQPKVQPASRPSYAKNSAGTKTGRATSGRFMDMVDQSGDAKVQHKHNYAAERQARLDSKLAAQAKASADNATEPAKPNKIIVAVDEPNEVAAKPDVKIAPANSRSETASQSQRAIKEPARRSNLSGRRSTQFSGTNRRSRHDLAQPSPVEPKISASDVKPQPLVDPYLPPFLPDAKVEKRPLGGGQSVAKPIDEAMVVPQRATNYRSQNGDNTSVDSVESMSDEEIDRELDRLMNEPLPEAKREVKSEHRARAKAKEAPTTPRSTEDSDQPVANRASVAKRSSAAYTQAQQTKTRKVWRTISWLLLFIAIIILGVLAGMACYYFGGRL